MLGVFGGMCVWHEWAWPKCATPTHPPYNPNRTPRVVVRFVRDILVFVRAPTDVSNVRHIAISNENRELIHPGRLPAPIASIFRFLVGWWTGSGHWVLPYDMLRQQGQANNEVKKNLLTNIQSCFLLQFTGNISYYSWNHVNAIVEFVFFVFCRHF